MMVISMMLFAVGCGGDDDSSSDSGSSSTTSAASSSSSSASAAPSGGSGGGEVKIAVSRLHPGIGTPQFCTAGCAENLYLASVQETLFRPEYGDNMGMKPEAGVLATGWTLADDVKVGDVSFKDGLLTVKLGKVIPEHHARKDYF